MLIALTPPLEANMASSLKNMIAFPSSENDLIDRAVDVCRRMDFSAKLFVDDLIVAIANIGPREFLWCDGCKINSCGQLAHYGFETTGCLDLLEARIFGFSKEIYNFAEYFFLFEGSELFEKFMLNEYRHNDLHAAMSHEAWQCNCTAGGKMCAQHRLAIETAKNLNHNNSSFDEVVLKEMKKLLFEAHFSKHAAKAIALRSQQDNVDQMTRMIKEAKQSIENYIIGTHDNVC